MTKVSQPSYDAGTGRANTKSATPARTASGLDAKHTDATRTRSYRSDKGGYIGVKNSTATSQRNPRTQTIEGK